MTRCSKRHYKAKDGTAFAVDAATGRWTPVPSASQADDAGASTARQPQLALPWRAFDYDFASGAFAVNGLPLVIRPTREEDERRPDQQEHGDTGRTIWDGAVVLAKFLELRMASRVKGATVLEFGAGLGLTGLAAAALGASQVLLTDLPYCLSTLTRNRDATMDRWLGQQAEAEAAHVNVSVSSLDWRDPLESDAARILATQPEWSGGVDLLLGADVVWVEPLVQPFASAVAALMDRFGHPDTELWLAHQRRSDKTDSALWRAFAASGLRWEVVGFDDEVFGVDSLYAREGTVMRVIRVWRAGGTADDGDDGHGACNDGRTVHV
ncbi:unnamed protein product [Vitrella brassicaformis CCMP3155]|uniref:Uncharacterized protein n=1 Tax=Vitrella brassicaformis (strain CCMP3155) TaxID=1169540 RepID=A0A0G4GLJ1_VITBC|nr:unnamed protein product [Vitrella brassicaformis CCMP3155]|eukprot:CEM30986.1 unnamed protein product [Vitrella brassicaformis CCMP3155]